MPISAVPNGPQLHNVRLNQSFGDSPVGRLGNSAVQSAPAGAARTGGAANAMAPSPGLSLGARILNAVTPQGLRAESKVLGGLQATSALVGDLLGALSKSSGHSVDGLSARQLLDSLPQTAAPLTRRGADLGAVLGERISVHVKNMSTAQLVALRDGVALAQSSALASSHGPQLAMVGNAVGRELTQRLLDTATQTMAPILAKLVAELPREAANPGTVAFAFNELDGAAFTILAGHGESTSAANAPNLAALKLELIKTTLNTAADNGDISLAHMGAILGNLSSQALHNLDKQTTVSNDLGDTFVMTRLVSGAIGLRAQQAEAAFTQAADALLARTLPVADDPNGSIHNPQGFAKDLIAAATNLTQRREHGDICDLFFPEEMGDKSAQLLPHLERLCSPGNLPLGALSDDELHAFSKALSSLGVERGSDHVAAELARRKDQASASFGSALLATCTAAQSKDPHALLQSLKAFADASSSTIQTLQRLGAPIDGADKVMEFREAETTRALETLGTEQLGSLFAALNSPELKSLKGSLGDMGQTLLEQENTAAGRQLYNASLDLQSLPSLVRDVLVSRGLSLPEMPDEASYGTAELAPAGHAAIRSVFDVGIGDDGSVSVLTGLGSAKFLKISDSVGHALQSAARLLPGSDTEGIRQALDDFVASATFQALPHGTRDAVLTKLGDKFAYLDVGAAEALRLADPSEMRHTFHLIAFESMSAAQVISQLKGMEQSDLLGLIDHAFANDTPYGQLHEGGWAMASALKQMLAEQVAGNLVFEHVSVTDVPALRSLIGGLESGRYDPATLRLERSTGSSLDRVIQGMEAEALRHQNTFSLNFATKTASVVSKLDARLAELHAAGKAGEPMTRELASLRDELMTLRDNMPGAAAFAAFTQVFGFRFENTTAFSTLSPAHDEPDISLRRLGEAFVQAGTHLRAATDPETHTELAALDRMVIALPTAEKALATMSYLPSVVEDLSATLQRLSARDGQPHSLQDYPVLVFDQSSPAKLAENRTYIDALNARTGSKVMQISMAEASALGEKLGLREMFVTSQDGRAGFGGARNMSFLLAPMLHKALRDPVAGVGTMADLIGKPAVYLEGLLRDVLRGNGHEMVLMGDDDTTVQPGFIAAKLQLTARHENDYAKITTLTLGRATTRIPPVVHPGTFQAISGHEDAIVSGLAQIPLSITGAMRATQWEGDPAKAVEHQMAGALMHPGSCLDIPLPSEEGQFANYKHEVVDWLGTALHHPGDRFEQVDARLEKLATYYNQAQIAIDLLGVTDKPHSDVLPWNNRAQSFDNIGSIYAHAADPDTQGGIKAGFMARLVNMPVNQELLQADKAFIAMEANDRQALQANPALAEQSDQVKTAFLKASTSYAIAIAYRDNLVGQLVAAFQAMPPSSAKQEIAQRLAANPADMAARQAALTHLVREGGPGLDTTLRGAIASASSATPGFASSDIAKSMDIVATSTLVRFGALSTRLAQIQDGAAAALAAV